MKHIDNISFVQGLWQMVDNDYIQGDGLFDASG